MKILAGVVSGLLVTGVAGAAVCQQSQTFTYDVHGRLTAVTRTTGSTTQTTTYGLDAADNRTSRLLGAPIAAAAATMGPDADDTPSADGPGAVGEGDQPANPVEEAQPLVSETSPTEPVA